MLMVSVELNVLPPVIHSPVAPVLVRLVVSEKTTPLTRIRGDTAVKSPPKADEGPICSSVVAPVMVRLVGALPNCVNCFRYRMPEENPAGPIFSVSPADNVAVAVLRLLQK